jgi:hypothetical protein
MTQIVYIALQPRVKIERVGDTHYGQVVRDDNGEPIVERYEPKHTRRLYEDETVARREAKMYAGQRPSGPDGRVIAIDIDDELHLDATDHEKWQHAERQMFHWFAEHGRLYDVVHGKTLDKSDRDYHVRVKRNAEFRAHATTELRRLLEMFKPPDYVIEVRRDVPVSGRWFTDKDGAFHQDRDRVWPFVVTLKDARLGTKDHEQASDAHIFAPGETEGAAYASILQTIVEGRGFFPGT